MFHWIEEEQTLWEYLKTASKPVVLYGMGDGALKIMKVLEQVGIPLRGIFASDEFVRGHSFCGHPVLTLSQMEEQLGDFIILMAFAIFDDVMTKRIWEIARRHEFYAPDVPVVGEGLFTFDTVEQRREEIQRVDSLWADDGSRQVFRKLMNFKLSGKISYLQECTTSPEEAYSQILKLSSQESYIDLGAYKGDTIEEFLEVVHGQYKEITAFEPDAKNYRKLCRRVEELGLRNVACFPYASYKENATLTFASRGGRQSSLVRQGGREVEAHSVDLVLGGREASYIKMDVEGAESDTLWGCRQTIQAFKPKLLVSAYHRTEDLLSLPLQIAGMRPDYRFYLRHFQYIPAWDTNIYCV